MNFFLRIGAFVKRVRSSAPLDPARDWLVLFTLFLILFSGIVVWNVWAFDTVANGGAIGGSPAKVPAAFDRISLDKVRAIFDERAAEEAKYETGAYRYADPSQ